MVGRISVKFKVTETSFSGKLMLGSNPCIIYDGADKHEKEHTCNR